MLKNRLPPGLTFGLTLSKKLVCGTTETAPVFRLSKVHASQKGYPEGAENFAKCVAELENGES